jgi:hypothetical protein
VIDGLIFQAEAEIRWLDHCETSLGRHSDTFPPLPATRTATTDAVPERTTS